MSRFTRIVCDGPHCDKQVEQFSDGWDRNPGGITGDTPAGWHVALHVPAPDGQGVDPTLHFCSLGCVADYGATGKRKQPFNGGETVYARNVEASNA